MTTGLFNLNERTFIEEKIDESKKEIKTNGEQASILFEAPRDILSKGL